MSRIEKLKSLALSAPNEIERRNANRKLLKLKMLAWLGFAIMQALLNRFAVHIAWGFLMSKNAGLHWSHQLEGGSR